jgi:hypothetical protein
MAATRRPPAGVAALDAALSQALFTRFGGKQGPARRCGTHAQAAVSLLARSHSAAHVADALAACCLPHARSFLKMMERLGQGWLWFGAPIAVLVLSDDAALRRHHAARRHAARPRRRGHHQGTCAGTRQWRYAALAAALSACAPNAKRACAGVRAPPQAAIQPA